MKRFVSRSRKYPQDRLSYLSSGSSDMVFMGVGSIVPRSFREVKEVEGGGKRVSSSWVSFGQYPSLGGLKYRGESSKISQNAATAGTACTVETVEHGSVDVLVHIGRGSITLASIFQNFDLMKSDDIKDIKHQPLSLEEVLQGDNLDLLVGEQLMGLPVGVVEKDGVYLLDVLFCKMEKVEVRGYAFMPIIQRKGNFEAVKSEVLGILGCPRYFNCVGAVRGKLVLSFVGGFKGN